MSAKRISSLDVECPSCHAAAGRPCRNYKGEHVPPHEPRRRRARDLDAQLHPLHVEGQLPIWGKR